MTNLLPIPKAMGKIVASLSRLSKVDLIAIVIIALSTTQLARHFWPLSAYVYGVRVDYLSPAVYVVDCLIVLYLLLKGRQVSASIKTIAPIFPLVLTNLLFSSNPLATVTWSLRAVIYGVFVLSLNTTVRRALPGIVMCVAIFQVGLGVSQVIAGRAIQGPLYWLGERELNISSPNVAKWELNGQTRLRSYGTFSHPNVLAGWLVVATLMVMMLSKNKRQVILMIIVATLGIILTQSRAAAAAMFGVVIPLRGIRQSKWRWVYGGILSACVAVLLVFRIGIARSPLSVSERLVLMEASLRELVTVPVFGSGANASITLYREVSPAVRLLQPDHNSFTLFLSWFGVAGTIATIFFVVSLANLNNVRIWDFKRVAPLLPLVLLDHYFLTSVQGVFIILLYMRSLVDQKTDN